MQTLPPVDALQVWFALLGFPFNEAKTIQQATHVLKKEVQRIQTQRAQRQRIRRKQQFQQLRFWRPLSYLVTLSDTEELHQGTRFIIDTNSLIKQLQMLVYHRIKEHRRIRKEIRDQIKPLPLQIDVYESMFLQRKDYIFVADTFSRSLDTPIDVSDNHLWFVERNSVLFHLKPFDVAIRRTFNWNTLLDFNFTLPDHIELFRTPLQYPILAQDAQIIKQIIHDTILELFPK